MGSATLSHPARSTASRLSLRSILALGLCAIIGACGSSSDGDGDGDNDGNDDDVRRDILVGVSDAVILPIYREFDAQAQVLAEAGDALCAQRDADSLAAVRQAWRDARSPWKMSEAFGLGPVGDLRIDGAVDFWPVRAGDIEDELAQTTPIDDAYIDGLGASRKGLPVLEYLLFDPDRDDAALLAELSDGDEASRRCMYIAELAGDIAEQAATLLAAWEPGAGDFRAQLVGAGTTSEVYPRLQQGFDVVVNRFIFTVQTVEGDKLAKPLGRRDGGTPQPGAVESGRSGNSLADLSDNLAGVAAVYFGRHGDQTGAENLDALITSLRPDLAAQIRDQLAAAQEAAQAIPPPLASAVTDSPDQVEAAFTTSKELLRLLSADMASLLGVTLTFSDNDGD
ncbi:MAG: imelysin family protein [Myxococcota bacterium]